MDSVLGLMVIDVEFSECNEISDMEQCSDTYSASSIDELDQLANDWSIEGTTNTGTGYSSPTSVMHDFDHTDHRRSHGAPPLNNASTIGQGIFELPGSWAFAIGQHLMVSCDITHCEAGKALRKACLPPGMILSSVP